MIPEMLWIVGFYAAAAAWVHAMHGRSAGADANKRHYVLVAGNHQLQMEWYIRALRYFSKRMGTDIGITVVLAKESEDETGAIVELFAREHDGIEWIRSEMTFSGSSGSSESSGNDSDGKSVDQRERMMMQLESAGSVASPGQVIWVDLANEQELHRLPI